MEELAGSLTNVLGRPVANKTGLTGGYNFKLEWSTVRSGAIDLAAVSSGSGQSIFGALQSQLGLKLEALKGPVERFVVVRAERPSEN